MKIGSLDFAGGGVVHIAAGVAGLVGCLMLGKRKFKKESSRIVCPSLLSARFSYGLVGLDSTQEVRLV